MPSLSNFKSNFIKNVSFEMDKIMLDFLYVKLYGMDPFLS